MIMVMKAAPLISTPQELHDWLLQHEAEQPGGTDFNLSRVQLEPVSVHRSEERHMLVHFTHQAEGILEHGLLGTSDTARLGLTFNDIKREPGFNFAYRATEHSVIDQLLSLEEDHYGDEAFLFAADHLLVVHRGDDEEQVIFRGADIEPGECIRLIRETNWSEIADYDPVERREWFILLPGGARIDADPMSWGDVIEAAQEIFRSIEAPTPTPESLEAP